MNRYPKSGRRNGCLDIRLKGLMATQQCVTPEERQKTCQYMFQVSSFMSKRAKSALFCVFYAFVGENACIYDFFFVLLHSNFTIGYDFSVLLIA